MLQQGCQYYCKIRACNNYCKYFYTYCSYAYSYVQQLYYRRLSPNAEHHFHLVCTSYYLCQQLAMRMYTTAADSCLLFIPTERFSYQMPSQLATYGRLKLCMVMRYGIFIAVKHSQSNIHNNCDIYCVYIYIYIYI